MQICPLLAIAGAIDKVSPCECQREGCAWWVKDRITNINPETSAVTKRESVQKCILMSGGWYV